MAYTKYSLTPANNNAAPPDGAPEGMLPSAVNDTMRDMMAQIRDCGDGIRGGTYTMTAPVITGGSISGITDLAVADGGTGASTAANARTNLGAAASGANSDITSLTGLTAPLSVAQGGTGSATGAQVGFKNRIINGDMRIDQRNAGASVTVGSGNTYTLDRWVFNTSQASKFTAQQNASSVTPPVGFINYLGVTSSSAYTVGSSENFSLQQRIEGLNAADLGWGTANAKTITISFWVRSSLTGTFGGSVENASVDRAYPFTYTISSANTWEQKTITISGDTTGTWLTTNSTWCYLNFGLGTGSTLSGTAGAWAAADYRSATGATSVVGTNGATFYITGVQLEVGSSATGFEYRDYSTQLYMCQRYYEMSYPIGSVAGSTGNPTSTTSMTGISTVSYILSYVAYKVPKRTAPTLTIYDLAGNVNKCTRGYVAVGAADNSVVTTQNISANGYQLYSTGTYNATNLDFNYTASAEL